MTTAPTPLSDEEMAAARDLVETADLPSGSLHTAVEMLEDFIIEVDRLRDELETVTAKIAAFLEPHALVQRNLAWMGENGDLHVTEFTVCGRCVPEFAHFNRREDVPEGPCEVRAALGETGGTDA